MVVTTLSVGEAGTRSFLITIPKWAIALFTMGPGVVCLHYITCFLHQPHLYYPLYSKHHTFLTERGMELHKRGLPYPLRPHRLEGDWCLHGSRAAAHEVSVCFPRLINGKITHWTARG